MNPSTAVSERFMSPPANPSVRPAGMSPFNSAQNIGLVRMEQQRPSGLYQQQNVQHYITQQNHPRFPQPNMRFSNEDLIKQTALPHNNYIQNAPRGPVIANEAQNIQMVQQARFPGMQQPVRVPLNPNGRILTIQPNVQNNPRMGVSKPPSDLIQGNMQNAPYRENYKPQMPGNGPGTLSRKTSDLKISNLNQKTNENQLQMGNQFDNVSDSAEGEKKSHSPNVQTPVPTVAESLSDETNSTDKSIDLESNNKVINARTKNKEKSQKDNKSIQDTNITSGMVKKNIKFFEENDTSKTPLKPEMPVIKKKEKTIVVPPDVIKSDTNKEDYESGVDETPVVHPNLGSIFQVPRKVAKIPHLKASQKGFRKAKSKQHSEMGLRQSQIYRRPTISEFLKPGKSCLPFKFDKKKAQKNRNYGSKEELLAFFENTKSWKEMKRYGSTADQSTAKEAKLVHKPTTNGDVPTPKKTPSKLQTPSKRNPPVSPTKTPLKSPGTPGTPGTKSLPKTPDSPAPSTPLIKKVPMNKIHVGAAPSPNLKTVKSKIGSLANTTHKPGGGNVKIESHKIDLSKVQPRTEAKNDQYKPSGGDKKIQQVKLQWSAKSKVGSLENATYKPAGGDKKIETVKLDFKEKAKPKVGSKDNVKHVPGGGNVKIESQKLEFKAQSKVGSLDNVKHKPGGGDIKIFDDKTYLRQVSGASSEGRASGTQKPHKTEVKCQEHFVDATRDIASQSTPANSDLSIIREVEGRSAPGTPGRQTSVKLKKTTTIQSSEENPKVKNITEVIVTSQTPKKERPAEKSPTKQQVKVTYSKVTTARNKDSGGEATVGIIKLPANTDAPILKPSLSRKDVFEGCEIEKQAKNWENETDFRKAYTNMRNTGNQSGSPNLTEGKSNLRDESGLSKFLKDEIATQEKVGQMWKEQNSMYSTSSALCNKELGEQKEPIQTSLLANYGSGTSQQFRSQNPEIKSDTQINLNDSLRLNFFSNQNI